MTWNVYIVKCKDSSLYTGIAKDVEARIKTHNLGKGAKYTRGRIPVVLVYCETCGSQGDAARREYEIKSFTKQSKLQLIATAQE